MLRHISLQDSIVYGPVQSRRLGSSLGINPLPLSYKLCSSNCVYCQYSWTPTTHEAVRSAAHGTSSPAGSVPARSPERVKRAAELLTDIEAAFRRHAHEGTPVDCVTLAGNGEPTLHPDLDALIVGIKELRGRYFPSAKVGILSDATQAHRPEVAQALGKLDERYMKVDGADEATWRAVTQPLGAADWNQMIGALKRLPKITLQSMFVQGSVDNTGEEHIHRWIELVGELRPLSVQVYTVDRAPADSRITNVPAATLDSIARRLTQRTGIPAEVYE